jgi:hypothetical protein
MQLPFQGVGVRVLLAYANELLCIQLDPRTGELLIVDQGSILCCKERSFRLSVW